MNKTKVKPVTRLQSAFNAIELRRRHAFKCMSDEHEPLSSRVAYQNMEIGLLIAERAIANASGISLEKHLEQYQLLVEKIDESH